MDPRILEQLGLTGTESQIFVELLRSPALPAQKLAQRIGVPRTTVHSALDTLMLRRLVKKGKKHGSIFYSIDQPQALADDLTRQRAAINARLTVAGQVISAIEPILANSRLEVPRIEVHEGKARIQKFLTGMLPRWTESIKAVDNSTWGYQDSEFVSAYKSWISKAWKVIHVEGMIHGRILSSADETEKSLAGKIARREVRVPPASIRFESSVWVMGTYVVLIMTKREPHYLIQLDDTYFASNLRTFFKYLYEQSSKV